jgi:hypothetical protein
MRPFYRAICVALVNIGLQVSGYTNFGLACVLWAIAAILAFWGLLPWLAGLRFRPVSATSEHPQRVGYADAAPSQSAHALEVEPDEWLRDAIWRAYIGTWYVPPEGLGQNILESEKRRFAMLVIREFRQLASEGKLPIWGWSKGRTLWEEVPREFWRDNQIDHVSAARADLPEDIKARSEQILMKPDASGEWSHFKTSKAVIERLYPSQAMRN